MWDPTKNTTIVLVLMYHFFSLLCACTKRPDGGLVNPKFVAYASD